MAEAKEDRDDRWVKEAAAAFQEAIIDVLVTKTIKAALRAGVKQILLAGGVASNSALRDRFKTDSPMPVLIPPPVLCTDNAAMIACCAYYHFVSGDARDKWPDVIPGLSFAT
jgi:N6-L-threonylcarbamoyladenine synthase